MASTEAGSKRVLSPEEMTAIWEDKTLSHIFHVTLKSDQKANPEYHYLKAAAEEAQANGGDLRLKTSMLDDIILSLCSELGEKVIPLEYLLASWRRAVQYQRSVRESRLDQRRLDVLKEARRLCLSYIGYCFTIPDMFENCQAPRTLAAYLLIDPDNEHGMSVELLRDLSEQISEDEGLGEIFKVAIEEMRMKLASLDMTGDYLKFLTAFQRIISVKPLATLITTLPSFSAEGASAENIEKQSFFGPLFRISPIQPKVAMAYFANVKRQPKGRVEDSIRGLRSTSHNIQESLFEIVNAFIRLSTESRNQTLDFFARVINLCHKRRAIGVDPTKLPSDGFWVNATVVITRFCDPFVLDMNFSKISKVEVEYFKRNPRIDISDETKLNSDENTSKEFYAQKLDGASNFISEIFFLAVAYNYYGFLGTIEAADALARDCQELEQHIEHFKKQNEAMRARNMTIPADREAYIKKMEERLEAGFSLEVGMQVAIGDPMLFPKFLSFTRFLLVWLLRLVSPNRTYPVEKLQFPLSDIVPAEYSNLPEYFFEVIGDYYSHAGRVFPQLISNVDELVMFSIVFLRMSNYVKNPERKSKLVELLHYGLLRAPGKPNGFLGDILLNQKFATEHLLNALMNFYIDIETQYYHKFTARYYISQIVQRIWINKAYREKLESESQHNERLFVRFVALLLNDVTLVMDNSLTALAEINRLTQELQHAENMTPEERKEKETALAKAEKDARQYTQLANETIIMVKLFTAAIPNAFCIPELVDRLAAMLDYNLETLVGPKALSLKVENPERYHFKPRILLAEVGDVYLNLQGNTAFAEAVARDGRSYRPEMFERLVVLLTKYALKKEEQVAKIRVFAATVEVLKKEMEEGEEELGDIPDAYLDPILCTLMLDPVILPSSKQVVDRQTIASHLLSDPKDPFNRSPLKLEEVLPNPELKKEILDWVASKKAEKMRKLQGKVNEKIQEAVTHESSAAEDKMDLDSAEQV